MTRSFVRIALAGTLAALALPATASAATQTIGSALALPMSIPGQVCTANCLSVQQTRVVDVHPNLSPANGVITEWKVRSGDPDALYHLRVLTPSAGNSYIATATHTAPTAVPPGTTDTIFTYVPTTPLQIKVGQAIGVLQTGNPEGLPQNTTGGVATNVIANNFNGTFPDGLGATFLSDVQHELLLQATVRFCRVPNVVGLKSAAASQALTAAECAAKTTRKKTKKKKKRGKVTTQKTAADSTVPPGTEVEIVVGTKPKKKKK